MIQKPQKYNRIVVLIDTLLDFMLQDTRSEFKGIVLGTAMLCFIAVASVPLLCVWLAMVVKDELTGEYDKEIGKTALQRRISSKLK